MSCLLHLILCQVGFEVNEHISSPNPSMPQASSSHSAALCTLLTSHSQHVKETDSVLKGNIICCFENHSGYQKHVLSKASQCNQVHPSPAWVTYTNTPCPYSRDLWLPVKSSLPLLFAFRTPSLFSTCFSPNPALSPFLVSSPPFFTVISIFFEMFWHLMLALFFLLHLLLLSF